MKRWRYKPQMVAAELDLDFTHAKRTVAPHGDALYSAEYRIPASLRGLLRGRRVAIVDDVIHAGSAARATHAELLACGAQPVAIGTLLLLGNTVAASAAAQQIALEWVERMPSHLWEPRDCPLCAARMPLERPAAA